MDKVKWVVTVEQNGGEYTGWVTFYAGQVLRYKGPNALLVDGSVMEFDEAVVSFELVNK